MMFMTIKEAVVKSLDEIGTLANHIQVLNHIQERQYVDFSGAKTPASTISAQLGDFIRNGDSRIKRIKKSGSYSYYLTKNEAAIEFGQDNVEPLPTENKRVFKQPIGYDERSLHKLLVSYLKSTGIYAKTIFHEQSLNSKDNHQKWIHPDIVGVNFLKLHSVTTQNFLKAINRSDTLKLFSYEVKKEINSDYELKKCFFQAVSNSSWANYGYLVAFEISDSLLEEIERLNQSFGIGVIELSANPYESKVLFSAKYKSLDIKTMDKLCKINRDFERFIEQAEKLVTASEKYAKSTEKELEEFCDDYFKNDSEVEDHLKSNSIPTE